MKFKKDYEPGFCVVYRDASDLGLCSYLLTGLGAISYALSNRMIPVMLIDNKNVCSNDVNINYWGRIFQQPCGVEIDCFNKKYRRISGEDVPRPNLSMDFLTNGKLVDYWRDLCHNYIRLQEPLALECAEIINTMGGEEYLEGTLGVLCRGTDYTHVRPKGHPIQVDAYTMVKLTKERMNKENIDRLFLVTEDGMIEKAFLEEFGNRVLLIDNNVFYNYSGGYIGHSLRKEDMIGAWIKYYKNIHILSKCGKLLASRTSGSVMAFLLANKKMDSRFIDVGTY